MAVSLPDGVEQIAILALLADGAPRTGAWLALQLESTCEAVGEAVGELRARGIEIAAPARDSYRLPRAVELLDALRIRAALGEEYDRKLHRLEVLFEVDSTNTRLMGRAAPPSGSADALFSELQHAGRGRRGRRWLSPFGEGIAMSLGWTFRDAGQADPTLSLAVGVAISRALARAGTRHIRVKWPNDVWFDDRKVGGVLVELKTESGQKAHVVIGVGLNLSVSPESRREVEAGGTRIASLTDAAAAAPSRNGLAGVLLEEVLRMLEDFERSGFSAFRDEWRSLDALRDRPVRVLTGDNAVEGVARGVDVDGALLLDSGGRLHRFVSGDVSLRLNEGAA